ncbi:hypothetical protein D3C75_1004420 [compost metagenome]
MISGSNWVTYLLLQDLETCDVGPVPVFIFRLHFLTARSVRELLWLVNHSTDGFCPPCRIFRTLNNDIAYSDGAHERFTPGLVHQSLSQLRTLPGGSTPLLSGAVRDFLPHWHCRWCNVFKLNRDAFLNVVLLSQALESLSNGPITSVQDHRQT